MKRIVITRNGAELTEASLADSYFLRLRGLIGRDVEALGGLLIIPCNQIHCCFMNYPIDAVYLDKSGKILKIEEAVPVWHFCKLVKGGRSVLELPAGRAKALKLEIGEEIAWNQKK